MKNFSLSPRLTAVLGCVGACRVLADIGTDHAYLPIAAVRGGVCEKAVACDISRGPLEIAEKNIHAAGLSDRIQTRLGDGLQPLFENETDCITIAGMGGMRIMEILAAAPEKTGNARLILQPQHDLEELRRFLHSNAYMILEEKIVRERARFYVIIVAGRGGEAAEYTDAEYFCGRISGAEATAYLRDLRQKISAYFGELTDADARELAKKRLAWLDERINDRNNSPPAEG